VSELNFLSRAWNKVKKDSETVRAPALLYSEHDLMLRVARDMLNEDVSRIVIDDKEEYKKIALSEFYRPPVPVKDKILQGRDPPI